MGYPIQGLSDMYTVLNNERKLGGAIEVGYIRLRSGEQFPHAVITSVEMSGHLFYTLSFMTEQGESYICHIDDVSLIYEASHKRIHELQNQAVKQKKTAEKLKYAKRLVELNEGSTNPVFEKELAQVIEDIGDMEPSAEKQNVIQLVKGKIA
ncbi:hypothetical protein [Ammoniphilus sp. YIM 78166]|uniref:hypothetical protein n=1 Tax=Ammoniphilus sp. YIM 78166 TaxID=1644106 RepID=UPI0010703598|nr:hypothetical protein [Ammoniphilus sp. YIM 78166]